MIPVLMLAKPALRKPDGYTAIDKEGNGLPVWIVPSDVAQIAAPGLLSNRQRAAIESKFGTLTECQRAGLFATAKFIDAVRFDKVDEKKFAEALAFRSVIAKEQAREQGRNPDKAWKENVEWNEKFKNAVRDEHSYHFMVMTMLGPEILEHISFCIWQSNGVLDVGLLADGLQIAIGVHLVLSLRQSEGIATCGNEHCPRQKTFIRKYAWEEYCSKQCGDAVRKRRQREKAKLRSERKRSYLSEPINITKSQAEKFRLFLTHSSERKDK